MPTLLTDMAVAVGGTSIRPQSISATAGHTAIDMQGTDLTLQARLLVGAVTGSSPTFAVKLQESEDGSTGWTDITNATFTTVEASNNSQWLAQPVFRTKRYVRGHVTVGGSGGPTALMSLDIFSQDKNYPQAETGYTLSPQT